MWHFHTGNAVCFSATSSYAAEASPPAANLSNLRMSCVGLEWLTLPLRTLEARGSDLDPETIYPEFCDFSETRQTDAMVVHLLRP